MTWSGGSFGERARCVLAPNANMMTLDGTNTWILREPGAKRSVVVDPGPPDESHLAAIAEQAGDVAVVLLTHHHLDHSEAAKEFAERMGCGVRALDPEYRLGSEGLGDGDVVEVDGLEVLRRIRANENTRLLPVVILTSSKEEQDRLNGYSLGANSYVQKPVDFDQFIGAVRQLGLYWLILNEAPPR